MYLVLWFTKYYYAFDYRKFYKKVWIRIVRNDYGVSFSYKPCNFPFPEFHQ